MAEVKTRKTNFYDYITILDAIYGFEDKCKRKNDVIVYIKDEKEDKLHHISEIKWDKEFEYVLITYNKDNETNNTNTMTVGELKSKLIQFNLDDDLYFTPNINKYPTMPIKKLELKNVDKKKIFIITIFTPTKQDIKDLLND